MAQRTLLATHTSTDLDGLAALVGLSYLYPDSAIVLSDNLEPVVRDVLAGRELRVPVLRPAEVRWDEVSQVVVADAQALSRLGVWAQAIPPHARISFFDHHLPRADTQRPPGSELISAAVGSVCTLVTEHLEKAAAHLSPDDATLLLAGIYEDTGQLGYLTVTPRDFGAAKRLAEWGARPWEAAGLLQRLWDNQLLLILDDLEQSRRILTWGHWRVAVASAVLPTFVPDVAVLASRLGGGVDAVFLLVAVATKVFLIARAQVPGLDVARVVRRFGGDGHAEAASAVLTGRTLAEAEALLLAALQEQAATSITAAQMMSAPVISVKTDDPMRLAADRLALYRIRALVVLEHERAVGMLDADVVSAALAHGMAAEPCGLYARPLPEAVPPDAPLGVLRSRIEQGHDRLLPVMQDGCLVGVVTRGDVVRAVFAEAAPQPSLVVATKPRRHLADEVHARLGAEATARLRAIGEWAVQAGVDAYLVGGCVRDLVMHRRAVDWDIVVVGPTEPLLTRLRAAGAAIKTYGRYEAAHVSFGANVAFDLARARREAYVKPGALPAVLPGTLEQDLYRRDFALNAMALALSPERFGELIDVFHGLDDIKHKRIRVLHSLSFVEDPTRILRGLRLAERFQFVFDEQTVRLAERAIVLRLLSESEGTRLRREIRLAFDEPDPLGVLRAFERWRIFASLLPGYALGPLQEEHVARAIEWTRWYRLQFGREVAHVETLRLASLAGGLKRERGCELFAALKLPRDEIELWERLLERAQALENHYASIASDRPSTRAAVLEHEEEPVVLYWGMLHPQRREAIIECLTRWRTIRPATTGADLRALGLTPGPQIGYWLRFLRNKILDGELVPDRQAELELIRQQLPRGD